MRPVSYPLLRVARGGGFKRRHSVLFRVPAPPINRTGVYMKAFVLFLMLLTAQSVGAQTVNQPFTVSWDYSANTQTGFRIERAAPDGGFITIVTLPDTARYFPGVSSLLNPRKFRSPAVRPLGRLLLLRQ